MYPSYRTASAIRSAQARFMVPPPRQSRSGMAGAILQPGEEPPDGLPHLGPPRQAAPVRADQADQPVTLVNADPVALAGLPHAVDQQRLDVRLELAQRR